jgi:hypothetical protein
MVGGGTFIVRGEVERRGFGAARVDGGREIRVNWAEVRLRRGGASERSRVLLSQGIEAARDTTGEDLDPAGHRSREHRPCGGRRQASGAHLLEPLGVRQRLVSDFLADSGRQLGSDIVVGQRLRAAQVVDPRPSCPSSLNTTAATPAMSRASIQLTRASPNGARMAPSAAILAAS